MTPESRREQLYSLLGDLPPRDLNAHRDRILVTFSSKLLTSTHRSAA
jgi:hypothetical protein